MTAFSEMQTVKRRFFAMRNGVIADTLRRGGSPFRIIFGLNLPQIVEIAAETPHTVALAEELWNNSSTRESMLMAPMLYPQEEFSREVAGRWVAAVPSQEVADILCHRLLRHMPYAAAFAEELALTGSSDMERYTGLRLLFNLVSKEPELALRVAGEAGDIPLARSLAEEARFVLGEF